MSDLDRIIQRIETTVDRVAERHAMSEIKDILVTPEGFGLLDGLLERVDDALIYYHTLGTFMVRRFDIADVGIRMK